MNKTKEPIIIIGMHRSGTSMLTRILQQSGLFMGEKRINEDESIFFLRFNDWILKQTNSSWDNPYCYNFINSDFKNQIKHIYKKRQKSIAVISYLGYKKFIKYGSLNNLDFSWGWKDPRNTFTIDIWKEIYPDAKILHIYRNPVDVAQSLRFRANENKNKFKNNINKRIKESTLRGFVGYEASYRVFHLNEGYKLWSEYIKRALNEECLHIKYEDLLSFPLNNLKNIFKYIDINVSESKLAELSKFFKTDRKYAFTKNPELVDFYHTIKNDNLLTRLKYNNII